jgi:hypothetical protein
VVLRLGAAGRRDIQSANDENRALPLCRDGLQVFFIVFNSYFRRSDGVYAVGEDESWLRKRSVRLRIS